MLSGFLASQGILRYGAITPEMRQRAADALARMGASHLARRWLDAMSSGEASSTITGPWLIGMMTEDQSTQNVDTFQIPKGTTQATVGVTDVYVMFKDSQNKDAARAFTEFLMDPDRNLQFVKDRGFLPIYTSQFALPDFQIMQTRTRCCFDKRHIRRFPALQSCARHP